MTAIPKPPPGHEPVTLTPAQAATVAEAVAIAITQRDKFLRINGLVRGDLARDDPGIADLTALIDAFLPVAERAVVTLERWLATPQRSKEQANG